MATENQSASQIILFYGDDCPHCKIVEEYIKENKIQDKTSFSQKEVYYNQSNAKELEAKAKICRLPTDSIGVPFLWDDEKCLDWSGCGELNSGCIHPMDAYYRYTTPR